MIRSWFSLHSSRASETNTRLQKCKTTAIGLNGWTTGDFGRCCEAANASLYAYLADQLTYCVRSSKPTRSDRSGEERRARYLVHHRVDSGEQAIHGHVREAISVHQGRLAALRVGAIGEPHRQ